MKLKSIIRSTLAATLILFGCAAHAKEKPILERGWIGGHYDCAKRSRSTAEWLFGADHTIFSFPSTLAHSYKAGILTLALGTNTPAYLAGLRAGDLILELDHQPVRDLTAFWDVVAGTKPGALLPVKAFRDGKAMDFNVTVGREKYQNVGWFTVGLPGYIELPHLVPTREAPWFSLVVLGYENDYNEPVEFASVKEQYKHSCHPKAKQTAYDTDYRIWLVIFEGKKTRKILAQETAMAQAATDSGKRIVTSNPEGSRLRPVTVPPQDSMQVLTMASPKPAPPVARSRDVSMR